MTFATTSPQPTWPITKVFTMAQALAPKNSLVNVASGTLDHPDLEDAVRRLVGDNPTLEAATTPTGSDEVVAGFEVDGVKYALVRFSPELSCGAVSLSPREQEIVRLVAKGFPNKAVAAVLDLSTWTVATHLRRVFAKMNVKTRTEMVACAITQGLIHAPKQ